MQSCLDEETILDFVDGRLSASAINSVEQHADQCSMCLQLLAQASEFASDSRVNGLMAPPSSHKARKTAFASTELWTLADTQSGPLSMRTDEQSFPGYRIVNIIGSGGMGVVYRAIHQSSKDEVALKTVWARKPDVIAAMRREIHALSRLDHPNVVHIREQGVENGWPWYAIELVRGQTLGAPL